MDSSLRSTEALKSRIDALQVTLTRRFETLVNLSAVQRNDRTVTAVTEYSMKAETAGLIRAAEDVQTLIRQLQEMWLFGRLNALEGKHEREEVDGTAREVAELGRKLTGAKSLEGEKAVKREGGSVDGDHDGEAIELELEA
ncbi:hypothetical protein TI39_contig291g00021 [Zymoseptoria brevis]|uniref:Uncharacterized protein n=1 Tax=Zymoseptoria brevis TaxID=1047168 RepID=A0A0F4GVJ5_9PEZI|nr:hypothetical protein TI39_contig291g00021 [Zymoseptoria brevis]